VEERGGYRGRALSLLKAASAEVGDILEIKTSWGKLTGTLVPRYSYEDDRHLVVKLKTGYNVGLDVKKIIGVAVSAKGEKPRFERPPSPRGKRGLPRVPIISTGGTIASRVDYRTGAVHPAVSSEDLHALVPELSEIAAVEPEVMFSIYSENISPKHWTRLARRVAALAAEGASGVVITHGTDTMGYTSAALSFALQGVPIPVILVASQRSSDRPSSDSALNLIAGVTGAASADFSGVYVCMHFGTGDDSVAFHSGTRVRKNHTSARAAFESIGVPPAAVWARGGFEAVSSGLPKRGGSRLDLKPRFSTEVALLKFYPAMPPSTIESAAKNGMRAIVVEGTGLGHVSSGCVEALGRYVKNGGLAFMTSQCIGGRVDLNVYDTGRDLIGAGVVPLQDMLGETALVKAMWAVANNKTPEGVTDAMLRNVAGEMTSRSLTLPGR